MSKVGLWLNSVLATIGLVAFVSLAGFFGYKWLAFDEPNRSFGAGGSRGGTSFTGETTYMILTFVFGGIALFGIWLTVTTVRSRLRPKQGHLQQLEMLRAAGAISKDEYQRRRGQVISDI